MNRLFARWIGLSLTLSAVAFAAAQPESDVAGLEPGSMMLMGIALAGAAGYLVWKRRRARWY